MLRVFGVTSSNILSDTDLISLSLLKIAWTRAASSGVSPRVHSTWRIMKAYCELGLLYRPVLTIRIALTLMVRVTLLNPLTLVLTTVLQDR